MLCFVSVHPKKQVDLGQIISPHPGLGSKPFSFLLSVLRGKNFLFHESKEKHLLGGNLPLWKS